jgi:hypothetical protein
MKLLDILGRYASAWKGNDSAAAPGARALVILKMVRHDSNGKAGQER